MKEFNKIYILHLTGLSIKRWRSGIFPSYDLYYKHDPCVAHGEKEKETSKRSSKVFDAPY